MVVLWSGVLPYFSVHSFAFILVSDFLTFSDPVLLPNNSENV